MTLRTFLSKFVIFLPILTTLIFLPQNGFCDCAPAGGVCGDPPTWSPCCEPDKYECKKEEGADYGTCEEKQGNSSSGGH